jgi:rhamnogalacturonan endolyase
VHPSVVMCRGYYTRSFLAAWDFRDGKLTNRWVFDSQGKNGYSGQGNHSLSVADVDDDGKDEIIYGGMTVDDNGEALFSTRYGHGDANHVGDLDPENPGLELFRIQESFGDAGAHMIALKTGQTLWKKPSLDRNAPGGKGQGPGRGLAADIDPRYPGKESWVLGAGIHGIWDAKGNQIADQAPTLMLPPGQITYLFDTPTPQPRQVPTSNFRIYWDGDMLDELLDGIQIVKWDWEKQTTTQLLLAEGCTSINWTKANPSLAADILGDWREEVIFPSNDGKELRIFTTTIPTQRRLPTLMHDPTYRLCIAWQNVGYNQPPHVGFSVGPDMKQLPRPNITLVAAQKVLP